MKSAKFTHCDSPDDDQDFTILDDMKVFMEDLLDFHRKIAKAHTIEGLTKLQRDRVMQIHLEVAVHILIYAKCIVSEGKYELNAKEDNISDSMDEVSDRMVMFADELDILEFKPLLKGKILLEYYWDYSVTKDQFM